MNLFHKDGRGVTVDESGKEASAFVVEALFRLVSKFDESPQICKEQKCDH